MKKHLPTIAAVTVIILGMVAFALLASYLAIKVERAKVAAQAPAIITDISVVEECKVLQGKVKALDKALADFQSHVNPVLNIHTIQIQKDYDDLSGVKGALKKEGILP